VTAPHELTFAEAIDVIEIDGDHFRGRYPGWNGYPRVFGGVVLAQAISAAVATVEGPKVPNSLHGVFLRPATPGDTAELHVERVRDGRSFSTRQVTSVVGGKETSRFVVSFRAPEVSGGYQLAMGSAQAPTGRPTSPDQLPFEVIELGSSGPSPDGTYEWTRRAWIRSVARMAPTPGFQTAALAYASDITMMAFQPGAELVDDDSGDASLDHALWFHRPSDLRDWHLFELRCVSISSACSTVQGTIHAADGRLVASMAQELLIRPNLAGTIVRAEGRWTPEQGPA